VRFSGTGRRESEAQRGFGGPRGARRRIRPERRRGRASRYHPLEPREAREDQGELRYSGSPDAAALAALIARADAAAKRKPPSVVEKTDLRRAETSTIISALRRILAGSRKAGGLPYVRGTARSTLRTRTYRRRDHGRLLRNVRDLALATTSRERKYAASATASLRVFFLDPATRMNPHLNYAQWIRGRARPGAWGSSTRGSSASSRTPWPSRLLSGLSGEEKKGLADWLGAYLDWLSESPDGRAEAGRRNNHGTWYMPRPRPSPCIWEGSTRLRGSSSPDLSLSFGPVPDRRIATGGARRTRALHNSLFNLEAWFHGPRSAGTRIRPLSRGDADRAGIKAGLISFFPSSSKRPFPHARSRRPPRGSPFPCSWRRRRFRQRNTGKRSIFSEVEAGSRSRAAAILRSKERPGRSRSHVSGGEARIVRLESDETGTDRVG
jgi:hypothetical protein